MNKTHEHRRRSNRTASMSCRKRNHHHHWTLWLLITCCAIQLASHTALALVCRSNEFPDSQSCSTSDHNESKCFKFVERQIEDNAYVRVERYGCISGSDDSIGHLQCVTNTQRAVLPSSMACCSTDFCNDYLPDPDPSIDPRWDEEAPPVEPGTSANKTTTDLSLWPLAILTIVATVLCTSICCLAYKVAKIMFNNYWIKLKQTHNANHNTDHINNNSLDSRDSDDVCKVNFEDHFKSPFGNLHHNTASSAASTHTYTESECLSQKPGSPQDYEHSLASLEHTSTLPDMTSGRGTRILLPRTMARVVDSGVTVPVGSGRFGRVFKGTYHGEDVAVKAFQAMDHENSSREENILRKLNHENIVRYIASEQYSVMDNVHETWMFLEFCPYGSLCDFLDSNEVCGPQQAVKILLSIIRGLSYLHEDYSGGIKPPIAHRDIKSKNILMRTPETCCLADFGHAVFQVEGSKLDFGSYNRFQAGTIRYMAPEILCPTQTLEETQFYTFAQADLYQFGLILWEVCHRTALDVLHPGGPHRLPYDGLVPQNPTIEDMIKIVCEDNYRPLRSPTWERHSVMKVLSSLMVECWRSNPKARMETLGIKKRIKDLHDQWIPQQTMLYHNNIIENFSLAPSFANRDKDRARSTDCTL